KPELLADFARELEDDIGEGGAIRRLLTRLRDRPLEFVVDDLLDAVKPRDGTELFLDDFAGLLEGDDARGELAQALQALMDGGFADAEVARGLGSGVAG